MKQLRRSATASIYLLAFNAYAVIPTPETPEGTSASDGVIKVSRCFAKQGLEFASYGLMGILFILVAYYTGDAFVKWRQNKTEFGAVLSTAGIGAIILGVTGLIIFIAHQKWISQLCA